MRSEGVPQGVQNLDCALTLTGMGYFMHEEYICGPIYLQNSATLFTEKSIWLAKVAGGSHLVASLNKYLMKMCAKGVLFTPIWHGHESKCQKHNSRPQYTVWAKTKEILDGRRLPAILPSQIMGQTWDVW